MLAVLCQNWALWYWRYLDSYKC